MNIALLGELFKVYFLWDTTRGQRAKLKTLIKESLILALAILLFHSLSIVATALYVTPYIQNSIEGALFSMGMSLKDFGLDSYAVKISFVSGLIIATILEIVTVAIASKTIEEWQRYKKSFIKNSTNLKKWGVTLALLISLQVGTAFGGIINTIVLLQTNKADRELIKSKKLEMDNVTYSINLLQKKINKIDSGEYVPTKEELKIDNIDPSVILIKDSLKSVKAEYDRVIKEHEAYANNIRTIYAKKQRYSLAEAKINEHYKKFVKPILNRKIELENKVNKISSKKTSLTIEEYKNSIEKNIKEMQLERNKLYKHIKILENRLKKQANINNKVIAFAIGFALFLVIVQSFLENLATTTKNKISSFLDNLDPRVREKREARRNAISIDEKLKAIELEEGRVEEQKPTETEYKFIYDYTNKVLEYMKEFYQANNELPSMSKTIEDLDIKEHEAKNARRELRAKNFFNEVNKKIYPTEKFLEKIGN